MTADEEECVSGWIVNGAEKEDSKLEVGAVDAAAEADGGTAVEDAAVGAAVGLFGAICVCECEL